MQALSLYAKPKCDHKRQASANYTFNEMKIRLAHGDLKVALDPRLDEDSDESVGRPDKKRVPKVLSTLEQKFILNLNSCLPMHLGFYAPCNDDEWCYCPLSKLSNQKWLKAMECYSELGEKFCSSNKKFGPSDLVCHIQEKHQDLLGRSVIIYLEALYGNKFGQGEFI